MIKGLGGIGVWKVIEEQLFTAKCMYMWVGMKLGGKMVLDIGDMLT